MKIGDLVKWQSWYTGKFMCGLIIEQDLSQNIDTFYVVWSDDVPSWEDSDDIEVLNEFK